MASALPYDDGASDTPTNGEGVGGGNLTSSLETVSPINGTGSLRVAKDAANRQGQGKRFDFAIEDVFKNTLFPLRFLWRTDAGYVDGDIGVFIYIRLDLIWTIELNKKLPNERCEKLL